MLADTAAHYARLGFHIFPLHVSVGGVCSCWEREKCPRGGKHPRTKDGLKEATTDPIQVAAWWAQWPDANIGYVPSLSGIVILDLDRPEAIGELIGAGFELPVTPVVRTGKGVQYHYRSSHPDLKPQVNFMGLRKNETVEQCLKRTGRAPIEGVDLRAAGSYGILPPSLHPNGTLYAWEARPSQFPYAELPQWVIDNLHRGTVVAETGQITSWNRVDYGEVFSGIKEGHRNETAFKTAAGLRSKSVPIEVARLAILDFAQRCDPPMPESEALKCLESAYNYPEGRSPQFAKTRTNGNVVEVPPIEKIRAEHAEVDGAELMAREFEPIVYVVPDMISEGLTFVAGEPKVGKSWWTYDLADCASRGVEFMARYSLLGGPPVLYFDLEQGERRANRRQRHFQKEFGATYAGVKFFFTAPRIEAGLLEMIVERAQALGSRLIIIDTEKAVTPADTGRRADEREYEIWRPFSNVANDNSLSIVVLTHLRKGGNDTDDPFDRVVGSKGKLAAADAMLMMTRHRGKPEGRFIVTGRDIEDREYEVHFDRDSRRWTFMDEIPF